MKLNIPNKTLLASIVLTMLLSLHSCHSKKADYFHVFDIELASQLNNSKSQMEVNEFELLINLFNNTRYTYYLSDEKEKLVNNLDLGDQQFRLTEVYKEGSVNAFQFVDYKGMSFKINNESSNSNGIRGLDWDLVEIKNRKKTFWGFDCHFHFLAPVIS